MSSLVFFRTVWEFNDGGRAAAGFRGRAGDCVARAVAIAAQLPYSEVYESLASGNLHERRAKTASPNSGKYTAAHGINTNRQWFKSYMVGLGFQWTPTMKIGSGCRVHLVANELPKGRLVVSLSKHYTALIDGVIHDTHNPDRNGSRCVYGYWSLQR